MKFTMYRHYEGTYPIKTDDILTAVKISLNNEADLYSNGSLVVSWMGLTMEENTRRLSAYGVSLYVKNGRYCLKYIDETKNITHYFASTYEYNWGGENCVDVKLHDYRTNEADIEFSSIDQAVKSIQEKYAESIKPESIYITKYDDDGCESIKLKVVA